MYLWTQLTKLGKKAKRRSDSISVRAREVHASSVLFLQMSRVDGKGMGLADRVWHSSNAEERTVLGVCTLVLTLRAVPKHTVLLTRKIELNKMELDSIH